jgi:Manganese containing catalase
MLMDTATEEIGHVEMIATMVARLLETPPAEAEKGGGDGGVVGAVLGGGDTRQAILNAAMNPQHAIVTGGGASPRDSCSPPLPDPGRREMLAESSLVSLSLGVPAPNEEHHLGCLPADIERQPRRPREVIVVDAGSDGRVRGR